MLATTSLIGSNLEPNRAYSKETLKRIASRSLSLVHPDGNGEHIQDILYSHLS